MKLQHKEPPKPKHNTVTQALMQLQLHIVCSKKQTSYSRQAKIVPGSVPYFFFPDTNKVSVHIIG